jgi:hypothetical protein
MDLMLDHRARGRALEDRIVRPRRQPSLGSRPPRSPDQRPPRGALVVSPVTRSRASGATRPSKNRATGSARERAARNLFAQVLSVVMTRRMVAPPRATPHRSQPHQRDHSDREHHSRAVVAHATAKFARRRVHDEGAPALASVRSARPHIAPNHISSCDAWTQRFVRRPATRRPAARRPATVDQP